MYQKSLANTLKQLSIKSIHALTGDEQLTVDDLFLSAQSASEIRATLDCCQFESFYEYRHKIMNKDVIVIDFKLSTDFLEHCLQHDVYDMHVLYWHLEMPNPNNFTPAITSAIELIARSEVVLSENCDLTEMNKIYLNDELLSVL
jgi:hypothetical protein